MTGSLLYGTANIVINGDTAITAFSLYYADRSKIEKGILVELILVFAQCRCQAGYD